LRDLRITDVKADDPYQHVVFMRKGQRRPLGKDPLRRVDADGMIRAAADALAVKPILIPAARESPHFAAVGRRARRHRPDGGDVDEARDIVKTQ
jgi:hypothetical protein